MPGEAGHDEDEVGHDEDEGHDVSLCVSFVLERNTG